MKILQVLLPGAALALLAVGCDSEDTIPAEDRVAESENAEPQLAAPGGEHDAERKHGRHGKRGRHGGKRMAEKFASMDANSDGSVSKEEAGDGRLAEKFDEIDADKSGTITQEELRAHKKDHHKRGEHGERGEHRGKHHGTPEERATKMLEKYDANGNGSLSAEEVADGRLAKKFTDIDADGDGSATREELMAFKKSHHEGRGHRKHGKRHDKASAEPEAI